MNICRFCDGTALDGGMVKYGRRHYAHFACYLEAGKKLDDLHAWQINEFPWQLLKRYGLLQRACDLTEAQS